MFIVLVLALLAAGQTTDDSTVVRAVVLAADDTPLARSRITLQSAGFTPDPVFTDSDGRAAIAVPRAAYTLRISKAGFAPREIRGSEVSSGTIEVTLLAAAVLTGRVTDAMGDAVVSVNVAIRRIEPREAPQPAEVRVDTDDLGEFRLGNLVAGRYALNTEQGFELTGGVEHLAAAGATPAMIEQMRREQQTPRQIPALSETVEVNVRSGEERGVDLVHGRPSVTLPYAVVGGTITGVVRDEQGEPAEGAVMTLWQPEQNWATYVWPKGRAQRTDDRGRYRLFHIPAGRYVVSATNPADAPSTVTEDVRFLRTYYPGTPDIAEASQIEVGRSQLLSSMDMTVANARGSRVYGSVVNASGQPRAIVMLTSSYAAGAFAIVPRFPTLTMNGQFEFQNVPPGNYVLQAVHGAVDDPLHLEVGEFTSQRVVVAGADVGPLVLSTFPTSTVTGRIRLEGSVQSVSPNDFGLRAVPVERDEAPPVRGLRPDSEIEPDGTFTMRGLIARSRIALARAPDGWWIKSAMIGGIDAAEDPVSFGAKEDSRDDVTIVLAHSGATIAGRVVDDRKRALDAYSVVVFSTNRNQWFDGSRYVRTAGPENDGGFRVASLAPGEYYVAATDYLETDPTADGMKTPEALNGLARSAERVSIGEGQRRIVDLRLVPAPR
jgi:hypothetical protein